MENKTNTTTQKVAYTGSIPKAPMKYGWYLSKEQAVFGFFAFFAVTCAELLSTALPFIFKKTIDAASAEGANAFDGVLFWVLLFPVAVFFMYFFWRVSGFIGMQYLTRIDASSYRQLYTYLAQHSHGYFSDRFAGSLSNKVSHASDGVVRLLDGILWHHYPAVLGLFASGVLIFMTNIWVGFIYVALVVILIPCNVVLARYTRPAVVTFAQSKSVLRGHAVDLLTNISAVRQYARRNFEEEELEGHIQHMRASNLKEWKLSEWILAFNNLFIVLAVGLMMFVMYGLWKNGLVTIGDFVLVATLILSLQHVLTFIGSSINQFIRIYGEIEEGLAEILIDHEIVDTATATSLITNGGTIVWKDVSFEFGENKVFNNFNLTISAGQRLGLVGASGAGKTTFVSLLLRQHDVAGGSIMIDGQNIAEITQDSLREHIAVVPQEPMLFHRTIRENIAYGKLGATDEEVIAVAKKAQAHDFIMQLEQGYDTMVGERGVKLSGGQKQRVAIARAMLKDAPILVLDEATSALDSESEVLIQQALEVLMEGKTVIAVAHRLSTLREMDRIIVLDAGEIVEDGTHKELTHNGGIYERLWKHQAGGFLGD